MDMPEGLDKEQSLNYVIGLVTRQATMAEDATFSLLRALNEDFELAVGQQKMPMVSKVITQCVERFDHDSRLAEIRGDAVALMGRVAASMKKRNELVHSLWQVSEDPVDTRYETLSEIETRAKGTKSDGSIYGRTNNELGQVHLQLRGQQTSLNFLKFRTMFAFQSYRQPGYKASDPNMIEWYDKLVRGEFNVTDNGFELWDREFAARLATGR
jgi:hypothetical protein